MREDRHRGQWTRFGGRGFIRGGNNSPRSACVQLQTSLGFVVPPPSIVPRDATSFRLASAPLRQITFGISDGPFVAAGAAAPRHGDRTALNRALRAYAADRAALRTFFGKPQSKSQGSGRRRLGSTRRNGRASFCRMAARRRRACSHLTSFVRDAALRMSAWIASFSLRTSSSMS